ncbi:uncharacterized protein LOC130613229 [Hydractinia symbiolongicarpus]|uniref:uncharacterized protein LOC130613229 n=1 Tax=Hydractinia symbiolongicarpus TaxID=13093 RepID=UPI00254D1FDC|nr:uncharacterized protein LOC130613229 [Hydractinia symbiolongicarpus]
MSQVATTKYYLIFAHLVSSLTFGYRTQHLPSIVVHSRNHVFACQDHTIRVEQDDYIDFVCPNADHHAYANYQDTYENFYFLDQDKKAYDTCNATGGWKFLNCNKNSRTYWRIVFRYIVFPDQLQFIEGHTYYFIGTGFRTEENINNMIGGSCNATEDGRYPLKLKVYVCTREEVLNNTCNVCLSEGCYYKGCLQTCSEWVTISKIGAKKTLVQRKQCNNTLTGASHEEYREIAVNCKEWSIISRKPSGNKCIDLQKRECFSAENDTYTDYQEVESFCQPLGLNASPSIKDSHDKRLLIIGAIATAIVVQIIIIIFIACLKHRGIICSNNNNTKQELQANKAKIKSATPKGNTSYYNVHKGKGKNINSNEDSFYADLDLHKTEQNIYADLNHDREQSSNDYINTSNYEVTINTH